MTQRRITNIIKRYLDGDEFYTNYSPRISKAEIAEVQNILGIMLQQDHTFGASAGPIAVYPIDRKEFREMANIYMLILNKNIRASDLMVVEQLSLEKLEKMEELGFKLLGPIFKDTLAYVQIQRRKTELK